MEAATSSAASNHALETPPHEDKPFYKVVVADVEMELPHRFTDVKLIGYGAQGIVV